ncbi:hypothetical protein REPUB_Repub12eG0038800 [Reevesia pubescens]
MTFLTLILAVRLNRKRKSSFSLQRTEAEIEQYIKTIKNYVVVWVITKKGLEKAMEEPHSVNSLRRILSFSKRTTTTTSTVSSVEKTYYSAFGVSGEHGPKPSEVYGFVGSISTVVASGSSEMQVIGGVTMKWNFSWTRSIYKRFSVEDEFSREPSIFLSHKEGDEQPIDPISDFGINKINVLMFDDAQR